MREDFCVFAKKFSCYVKAWFSFIDDSEQTWDLEIEQLVFEDVDGVLPENIDELVERHIFTTLGGYIKPRNTNIPDLESGIKKAAFKWFRLGCGVFLTHSDKRVAT